MEIGGELLAEIIGFFLVDVFDGQFEQLLEWWELAFLAVAEFFLIEAEVVVVNRVLDGEMVGNVGLDDYFARFDATGTTSDLCEQLEGFFSGAEVWDSEASVGEDDANQCDVGEMEAFADHLGADENVGVAVTELLVDCFEAVFEVGGVAVGAENSGLGVKFAQFFFDFLGAEADVFDQMALTIWTDGRDWINAAAVMANQAMGWQNAFFHDNSGMIGQGD